MTTISSLVVEITASTIGLTRGLSTADKGVKGFVSTVSDSLKGIGSSMTELGAGMSILAGPLLAGFAASVSSAMEFNEAMTNVGAVLGKSSDEMAGLSAEILAIGANSRAGPQEVARSFYDIVGGVADATTHMAILNAAIATSEAGNADLTGTTSALISVMNSYGFAAEKAGFASDVMTRLVGMGVGSMDQFAAALPAVTGLASSLGIPLEDVGAAMAFITTKGFSASEASTQLAAMMTAMIKPNATMTEGLTELGFSSGQAAIESMGLVDAYKALSGTDTAATDGMAAMVGTTEALNGVISTTSASFGDFSKTFKSGIEGATDAARAIQMASPAAQFDLLKSSVSGLAITVGSALLPNLNKIAADLKPIIDSISQWVTENPELVTQIAQVTIAVAGLGIGLVAVGSVIGAVGTIAGAVGAVIGAVGLPVIALGAAVGLLLAVVNDPAIQAGLASWQGVFDMLPQVMEAAAIKIDQTFNDAAVSIRSFVRDIKGELAEAVAQIALAGQALGLGIGDETVNNMAQEFATIDVAKQLEAALSASMAAGGPLQFDMAQIEWITSDAAPAGLFDKLVSNIADPRLIQEALGSAISMGDMQAVEVLAPLALKFADDPALQMQELLTQAFTLGGPEGQAAFQALVPLAAELGIDTQELIMQMGASITTAATEGTYNAAVDVGITLNPIFSNMGAFNSTIQSAAQSAGASAMGPALPPGMPSFDTGGFMPHDGPAMLHAGEYVLTPPEARAYNDGGGNSISIAINGVQDVDSLLSELHRRGVDLLELARR